MEKIKFNLGLKEYEIEDEKGNVRGIISFNPSDYGLLTRANDLITTVEERLEKLYNLKEEDLNEKYISDFIKQSDIEIKKGINYLFDDENTSSIVFGNQLVFTTVRGETLVERFINIFMPIIKKEIEKEQKKSQEKIKKYTEQVK